MHIELNIVKNLFTAQGNFDLKVGFSIEKGELVALYGPSGVGKTTLLRIIAGLADPDAGELVVNNELWYSSKIKLNRKARHRNVGYVFQDYALFPNMTVYENISFAQDVHDEAHINELLDLLQLTVLKNRKPSMLSGGQQQRVALARAMARKPDILLLDEPFSSLDINMRVMLQHELLLIQKNWGITTILVTHDLSEVFKMCGRVIVLDKGAKIHDGNPMWVFGQTKISGKVQFLAEVLHVQNEDIVQIVTLLVGNLPVKVAVSNQENYQVGEKVLLVSKAFNPILIKV